MGTNYNLADSPTLSLLITANSIVAELIEPTIDKILTQITKFIDTLPEQLNDENQRMLIVPSRIGVQIKHQEALCYPNGETIPFIYNTENLTEEQLEKVDSLAELKRDTLADVETMRKQFHIVYQQIAKSAGNLDPKLKVKLMVDTLPDLIKELESIKALDDRFDFLNDILPEDIQAKNIPDLVKNTELDDLINKYYGLGFLTDF